MTTITAILINLNIGTGTGTGTNRNSFLNPEKVDMAHLSQQMEAIIPSPEAMYEILDEADAIKITEVSMHSIHEGTWQIVGDATTTTYRFELIIDVRHIGTISCAAITKISDAIFKNGAKTSYCFTDPFHIYTCSPTSSCDSDDDDNDDDDDEAFYDLIEMGIASNGGRLQVR